MRAPATPPDIDTLLPKYTRTGRRREILRAAGGALPSGRYLHWDQLRHRQPPRGLSREEWWLGIKLARQPLYQELPLVSREGRPFRVALLEALEDALDRLTAQTRGLGALADHEFTPEQRVEARLQEAIHSAQMEGAAIGTPEARGLIESGRDPVTQHEKMVADAYRALELVEEASDEPLTSELITEIHQAMTRRTLALGASGRLRQAHEEPRVYTLRGEPLFTPPPADELIDRLADLCAFANGELPDWPVAPLLRGILIHLWVGYEHPFVDGNGRVARALFRWAMLSQGFPLFEYLPLSRYLRRDKTHYERAYLYTTTDGFDATYFALFLVETITEALDDLGRTDLHQDHVPTEPLGPPRDAPTPPAGKHPQATLIEHALRAGGRLNERQLALVERALRHPEETWTIKQYQAKHHVAYETARLDLQDLYARGLVTRERDGRAWEFHPSADLADRLLG